MECTTQFDRATWNAFVAAYAEDGGLLQSWEWGALHEAKGNRIIRLGFTHSGTLAAVCLLIEERLPFGWRYWYAPRGPVVAQKQRNTETTKQLFGVLEKFARERGAVFLRIEPPYHHESRIMNHESWKEVAAVQPKQTLRIDLTKSEDELLRAMHPKTRYNTRLALKNDVRVENFQFPISNFQFDLFFKLLSETTKRDGFSMHPHTHYEALLSILDANLFFAFMDEQPLAAALVVFFGTTAYYLHGASANAEREVMAPYALHWEIIREAKKRGMRSYDFWGVDAKRWPGVTRFKQGFARFTAPTVYAGTWDFPLRRLAYHLYCFRKFLR